MHVRARVHTHTYIHTHVFGNRDRIRRGQYSWEDGAHEAQAARIISEVLRTVAQVRVYVCMCEYGCVCVRVCAAEWAAP